jgi:hypothetical protein
MDDKSNLVKFLELLSQLEPDSLELAVTMLQELPTLEVIRPSTQETLQDDSAEEERPL